MPDDVRLFLKEKGFTYSRPKGDDEFWVNKAIGDRGALVMVPQRNNKEIPLLTMDWMVKRSRIEKKVWIEWKRRTT